MAASPRPAYLLTMVSIQPKTTSKPWSKLRSRIEALCVPELTMAIHLAVWTRRTQHFVFHEPRHWITLNKETIWDFPRPFMCDAPARGKPIPFFEEVYGWTKGESSVVADLLRDYLDRRRNRLFEPFDNDHWELGDILRAADRRIGRERLTQWAAGLDGGSPAMLVVQARLGGTRQRDRSLSRTAHHGPPPGSLVQAAGAVVGSEGERVSANQS